MRMPRGEDDPPWLPFYEPPAPGTVCRGHWECVCKYKWVHKSGISGYENEERLGECPPLNDPTCEEKCKKFVYNINFMRWRVIQANKSNDDDMISRLNKTATIKRFGVGPFDDINEGRQRVVMVSAKCVKDVSVCGGCN